MGVEQDEDEDEILPSSFSSHATSPISDKEVEQNRHRRRCTHRFLHLVLHTRDEQLWKDMLSSALRRYGTLQTRHLEEWLRRIRWSTPSPIPTATTTVSSSTSLSVGSDRQGEYKNEVEEDDDLPPWREPYERLQRVAQIVQYVQETQEEMQWERKMEKEKENKIKEEEEEGQGHEGVREKREEKEKDALPVEAFLCTPRILVQLLVLMLHGAENAMDLLRRAVNPRGNSSGLLSPSSSSSALERNAEGKGTMVDIQFDTPLSSSVSSSEGDSTRETDGENEKDVRSSEIQPTNRCRTTPTLSATPPSSPPLMVVYFSYAALWHFLAWMERHHLHLHSEKLIDSIEATVDLDVEEEKWKELLQTTAYGESPLPFSSSFHSTGNARNTSTSLSHQALHCRREARLAYLQSERVLAAAPRHPLTSMRPSNAAPSFLSSSVDSFPTIQKEQMPK